MPACARSLQSPEHLKCSSGQSCSGKEINLRTTELEQMHGIDVKTGCSCVSWASKLRSSNAASTSSQSAVDASRPMRIGSSLACGRCYPAFA